MKTLTTSLTLTALLIATPALAQTQAQDTPRQTQSRTTEMKDARSEQTQRSQSGQANAEASKRELKVSERELQQNVTDANKASKIIGMEVRNLQDERIGKVKDLAIDTRSGRVAYAVVESGGSFFGSGKNVAVPIEALTAQPGQKYFVIDADKDRLASAPGFADDSWPSLNEARGQTVGLSAATVETEEEREAMEDQREQQQETREEQRNRAQDQQREPRSTEPRS